jgi:hypothetical protein
MARIIIPLNEAIQVLQANVQLGDFVKRIETTAYGPRLVVSFPPLIRETNILIRFVKFEAGTVYFSLDGVPTLINLNTLLKLPQGISVSGTLLRIQPDVLIRTQLNLQGISVQNVSWDNGAFTIDTAVS